MTIPFEVAHEDREDREDYSDDLVTIGDMSWLTDSRRFFGCGGCASYNSENENENENDNDNDNETNTTRSHDIDTLPSMDFSIIDVYDNDSYSFEMVPYDSNVNNGNDNDNGKNDSSDCIGNGNVENVIITAKDTNVTVCMNNINYYNGNSKKLPGSSDSNGIKNKNKNNDRNNKDTSILPRTGNGSSFENNIAVDDDDDDDRITGSTVITFSPTNDNDHDNDFDNDEDEDDGKKSVDDHTIITSAPTHAFDSLISNLGGFAVDDDDDDDDEKKSGDDHYLQTSVPIRVFDSLISNLGGCDNDEDEGKKWGGNHTLLEIPAPIRVDSLISNLGGVDNDEDDIDDDEDTHDDIDDDDGKKSVDDHANRRSTTTLIFDSLISNVGDFDNDEDNNEDEDEDEDEDDGKKSVDDYAILKSTPILTFDSLISNVGGCILGKRNGSLKDNSIKEKITYDDDGFINDYANEIVEELTIIAVDDAVYDTDTDPDIMALKSSHDIDIDNIYVNEDFNIPITSSTVDCSSSGGGGNSGKDDTRGDGGGGDGGSDCTTTIDNNNSSSSDNKPATNSCNVFERSIEVTGMKKYDDSNNSNGIFSKIIGSFTRILSCSSSSSSSSSREKVSPTRVQKEKHERKVVLKNATIRREQQEFIYNDKRNKKFLLEKETSSSASPSSTSLLSMSAFSILCMDPMGAAAEVQLSLPPPALTRIDDISDNISDNDSDDSIILEPERFPGDNEVGEEIGVEVEAKESASGTAALEILDNANINININKNIENKDTGVITMVIQKRESDTDDCSWKDDNYLDGNERGGNLKSNIRGSSWLHELGGDKQKSTTEPSNLFHKVFIDPFGAAVEVQLSLPPPALTQIDDDSDNNSNNDSDDSIMLKPERFPGTHEVGEEIEVEVEVEATESASATATLENLDNVNININKNIENKDNGLMTMVIQRNQKESDTEDCSRRGDNHSDGNRSKKNLKSKVRGSWWLHLLGGGKRRSTKESSSLVHEVSMDPLGAAAEVQLYLPPPALTQIDDNSDNSSNNDSDDSIMIVEPERFPGANEGMGMELWMEDISCA